MGQEAAFGIFAKAKELEKKGKTIIHMEIGEPDFPTPKHIVDAAITALNNGDTHYTPTPGLSELRSAIANSVSKTYDTNIDFNNVLVTVGGKEAVFGSIVTVTENNTEIIFPNPGYPAYESATNFAGGKAISCTLTDEFDFRMTPENVNELINDKTIGIVINSPGNPCGSILTKDDVKGITEIAVDHNLYVISDELYSSIIFDNEKHFSPLNFVDNLDNVILIDGFSKKYAMTGWRLGYAVVPTAVSPPMSKLLNNLTSCPASFVQRGGIAAINGPETEINKMIEIFRERRDVVYAESQKINGIKAIKPKGAFYLFFDVTQLLNKLNMNSEQLVIYLLENYGIAMLHGTAMGSAGEGYLRISFANSVENLKIGMNLLATAANDILKL